MAAARKRISPHAWFAKKAMREAKQELAERMRTFSMAELTASKYSAAMVEVLAGIAMDPTADIAIRRLCAVDVIERADGKVWQKVQMQHSRQDPEDTVAINTIEHEAAAAQAEADLLSEAERWISSGLAPEAWPDNIRERFGVEALAAMDRTRPTVLIEG